MQASTVGLVLAPTLLHLTLRIGRIIEYRPGSALSLSLSYARYDILYILLVYGGLTVYLLQKLNRRCLLYTSDAADEE